MQYIEKEEEGRWLVVHVPVADAEKSGLAWNMLEHNQIPSVISPEYYYVDDQVCFRYLVEGLQPVEEYFEKKEGGFESLYLLCYGIVQAMEAGQEYLLEPGGYLLLREGIFWKRQEKQVWLCYVPGRKADAGKEYTTIVEYLLQHTDHREKKAVSFIYQLYDVLMSDGFSVEGLLDFFREYEQEEDRREDEDTKVSQNPERPKTETTNYSLRLMLDKLPENIRWAAPFCGSKEHFCLENKQSVGRLPDCQIRLPFPGMSRRHAELYKKGGKLFIMDKASANGTYLNGRKLKCNMERECNSGDIIRFAGISFRVIREEISKT